MTGLLKKGQHYGTILVDLEKRQPIDLLQGREAAPLEEWLKKHPEIQVITRDRAGAYADGARKGAPQAQQVADRLHLLKNANEAFERLIQRHQKIIREAVEKLPAPQQETVVEITTTSKVVPETASEYMRSRYAREQRQAFHAERKARYDRVQELKRQGYTIIQIKKHLGLSYSQVAGFYIAEGYPVINRAKGRSKLDEFDDYLRARWSSGCNSAGQLYRELCEKGYTGSDVTFRRHVQLWREKDVTTLPPAPIKGKTGWWDVEARGKGFGLKFRWRSHGVKTLTFARVSRATFRKLQKLNGMAVEIGGKVYDKAEWYLSDWIAGQLDDFSRGRDRERRAKAGEAATRLGLAARDD